MARKPGDKGAAWAKLCAVGIDAVCERIAEREYLRVIAADIGVSRFALMSWLKSPENIRTYDAACEMQATVLADEILEISDDGSNDTYVDADGNKRTDQDAIQRSRLRVDSRKWLAAKMNRKYAERSTVDVNAEVVVMTDDQRKARLAELLAKQSSALIGNQRTNEMLICKTQNAVESNAGFDDISPN